ncbi:NAD(P)H dehydrogenase (quinone) FQR1-like isoform X1 [Vigna angularis]|uniref:NAD(P)H dehydrogenase (quinone) FQR1-like isoform X1 n=1 Tax=Phaseolus angularis TaxID=3914 RepID=UPI0022B3287B|nr:NAD(P)H dehydrogenase (quinone) FQR1-like isoform X1 [Vigna angularis]
MSLWNQESEGRFPRCSSTWTACFATTKSLLENPTSICLPRWASKSPSTILWHLREQVPETLSAEERIDLRAPPKNEVPVVNQIKLPEADGFIFGFPERFGMMASQFKAFHDSTQFLWKGQMLASKPAGIFYATSSQGGGQETAA